MEHSTRIGVYLDVRTKKREHKRTFWGCDVHGSKSSDAVYCPRCGKPCKDVEQIHIEQDSFYDVDEDGELKDIFYQIGADNLELEKGRIILVGNKESDSKEIDTELSEITPDMIRAALDSFLSEYAQELEKLRTLVQSVDVKFGVVTNWS